MDKLTWERFDSASLEIAETIKAELDLLGYQMFKNIYGIPRGGLIVAVRLSHLLDLPLTDTPVKKETLIVDDICDSGKTLQKYNGYATACIYKASNSITTPTWWIIEKKDFVQFQWETEKTAKIDYEERT